MATADQNASPSPPRPFGWHPGSEELLQAICARRFNDDSKVTVMVYPTTIGGADMIEVETGAGNTWFVPRSEYEEAHAARLAPPAAPRGPIVTRGPVRHVRPTGYPFDDIKVAYDRFAAPATRARYYVLGTTFVEDEARAAFVEVTEAERDAWLASPVGREATSRLLHAADIGGSGWDVRTFVDTESSDPRPRLFRVILIDPDGAVTLDRRYETYGEALGAHADAVAQTRERVAKVDQASASRAAAARDAGAMVDVARELGVVKRGAKIFAADGWSSAEVEVAVDVDWD